MVSLQIDWGSFSLPNTAFIVVTILAWAGIHGALQDKDVELYTSRVLLSELPPAATFSYTLVYYTLPAIWGLIFGETGSFVQIMSVLGALMFNVSAIGWITFLRDADAAAIRNMQVVDSDKLPVDNDEQPDDEQPDDEQPDDEQPDDEQPDDEQPDDEQPDDEQPDDEQPDDEQPDDEQSGLVSS